MTVVNDVLLAMEGRDNLAEVSTFPPCMHTLIGVRSHRDTHPQTEDNSQMVKRLHRLYLVDDTDGVPDVDLLIRLPQFTLPVHGLPEQQLTEVILIKLFPSDRQEDRKTQEYRQPARQTGHTRIQKSRRTHRRTQRDRERWTVSQTYLLVFIIIIIWHLLSVPGRGVPPLRHSLRVPLSPERSPACRALCSLMCGDFGATFTTNQLES